MTRIHFLFLALIVTNSAGVLAENPDLPPPGPLGCAEYVSPFLKKNVGFCMDRSRPDLPFVPGEPVIYFMHGAATNARQWFERPYSEDLHEIARTEGFPAFTVISFDTEAFSFFSDRGNIHSGPNAYETWFLHEFVPFIEKRFGVCSKRACRGVMGTSMGGFGALKTGLRHPDLFMTAAGNEPAILPANPYARSDAEWSEYFSNKKIGSKMGLDFIHELKDIFPSSWNYDQNDPVVLVRDWLNVYPLPGIYFDVTGGDEFGFYDGFARFEKMLWTRDFPFTNYFEPDGTHMNTKECRKHMYRFVATQLRGGV